MMASIMREDLDGDGDDGMDQLVEDEEEEAGAAAAPPALSRSWAVSSAHVPSYTGGRVVLCRGRGARNLYGYDGASKEGTGADDDSDDGDEEGGSSRPPPRYHPFLLAPCAGDLSIIDAAHGVRARGLRSGCSTLLQSTDSGYDDDDEGGLLDRDAITAYALAPNDVDLITCTRSSVLRQYDVSGGGGGGSVSASYSGPSGTGPARIRRTIGKSGHSLPVTRIEFHPSGIFFATGSVDGAVRVWDMRGGYATHSFRIGGGVGGVGVGVSALVWHPDPTALVLAIGREDGTVCLHDLRSGTSPAGGGGGGGSSPDDASSPLVRLADHVSAVTCLAWVGRDNGLFVTAGRDAVINTWAVEEEIVNDAAGDGEGGGKKRRKKKKKKRRKSRGDDDGGDDDDADAATTPPRTRVLYRRIRTLPVYEQLEGMVALPRYHHHRPDLVANRHDVVIATAGSKGLVRIWRARHLDPTDPDDGDGDVDSRHHRSVVSDFECIAEQEASSAFGEERGGYTGLLRTSHTNRLRARVVARRDDDDAGTGGMYHHFPEELIAVDAEHNMTFLGLEGGGTGDNDKAGRGGGRGGEVDGTRAVLRTDRTIVGHNDEILDLRVLPTRAEAAGGSPSGSSSSPAPPRRIAVATNSAQVRIFEIGTYSCTVLDGHTDTVLSLDASPCGRYLATSGKDKTMRLWHVEGESGHGRCVAIATGHTEAVGAAALSRKVGRYEVGGRAAQNGAGAFAVTASRDRTLKRWALPGPSDLLDDRASSSGGDPPPPLALRALGSTRAHEKDINVVTVAPNDSLVATGSQDKTVKLWNSTDLTLRGTLRGHKRGVWDCQFSPFDRVVATCSGDRTVKLWSLGDFTCVRTFQGHAASTLRVKFLSGGLQLLSSGADGLAKLWTIRTNECEATLDGHSDKVWALDLSPDGSTLVTGGADSKIIVWKDTTKEVEDAKRDEEEKNILMEQRLANHLRFKEFEKALEIALELDKPRQALKVLTSIIENDVQKGQNGMATLCRHVKSWEMSRTAQVLRYCRDWNTRARNSHVAMLTIKAIVSSIPAHTLAAADGIPEILAGVTPYAERHFQRLDRLYASSYLIDYALFSMGSLDDGNAEEYSEWEAQSKLVLPPKQVDGRVQVGGATIIGLNEQNDMDESSDDEVVTVGDSETSSESESGD